MWVKSMLLADIERGDKDLEIRPAKGVFLKIKCGDRLVFNQRLHRTVVAVRRYESMVAAVIAEPAAHLWPGHRQQEVLAALADLYNPNDDAFVVFELVKTP
ncbi:MAG TPA: hypothetical protein VGB97_01275 [Candidatus Paceibacterota bacterium]|jgi:ASC-1-like (ASCH) protein